MDSAEGTAKPSVADLWSWRSDWEDVEVPGLGGHVVRVFALSGTARAKLVPEMAALAKQDIEGVDTDPVRIRAVFDFQTKVVCASLGFPEESWSAAGEALGAASVELLYEHVARISGLAEDSQDKARERLSSRRNAGSGTA